MPAPNRFSPSSLVSAQIRRSATAPRRPTSLPSPSRRRSRTRTRAAVRRPGTTGAGCGHSPSPSSCTSLPHAARYRSYTPNDSEAYRHKPNRGLRQPMYQGTYLPKLRRLVRGHWVVDPTIIAHLAHDDPGRTAGVKDTHSLFDEVFDMLEQERRRFDEELGRLTAAAAYLRALLPYKGRTTRRLRCAPRRRRVT
jgi:hypothetical protein